MRNLRPRFLRNRDGIAAVEFALVAPIFLAFLGLLIDFGAAFNTRMKLSTAVAAAGQYAFAQGQGVSANTAATLITSVSTIAQNASNLSPAPAVTVRINNAADGSNADSFYCLSGYNPVAWSSTGNTAASCGSSVTSGKFVTITMSASRTYWFLPSSIAKKLAVLTDTAIVRVQ